MPRSVLAVRAAPLWASLALLAACPGPDPTTPESDLPAEPTGDTAPTVGESGTPQHTGASGRTGRTGTTGATGRTGDTAADPPVDTADTGAAATGDTAAPDPTSHTGPVVDCLDLPRPGPRTYHTWIRTSEEFTFDDLGNMINISDGSDAVWRTPYGGPPELVAPYQTMGEVAGHRFMLDGDLAVADEGRGAVMRQAMSGARTVINGSVRSPNSIAIRDDGMVFVSAHDDVKRIHPITGNATQIWSSSGWDLDGLTFSPDFDTLYLNLDERGHIWALELNVLGGLVDAVQIDNLPNQFYEIGGQTVDVCGNLYVLRTDGKLWRIYTDGRREWLVDLRNGSGGGVYTTSLNFGSGLGGFASDRIYALDRSGGLIEMEMFIDGKWEPHLPPR